ncbi:MAG: hypothetical protein HY869_09790 [Chloroflexi bacterium]|nr:hypothetical protein [Chloroflexota bacterium]
MKSRLSPWIALILAAAISLGCELVNSMLDPGPLRVESVDVAPLGNGVFTASVGLPPHRSAGALYCNLPQQDGGPSQEVYRQTIPPLDTSRILTFEFTLNEPGEHRLYCTADPIGVTAKTTFSVDGPTPPGSTPAASPAPGQPVTINGVGQKVSYSGAYSCAAAQQVSLVVRADGTAELSAVGPGFIDHINCIQSDSAEGWYIVGVADQVAETVSFSACNNGGFNASGVINYAGGALSGEVSCLYNQGSTAGQTAVTLKMP